MVSIAAAWCGGAHEETAMRIGSEDAQLVLALMEQVQRGLQDLNLKYGIGLAAYHVNRGWGADFRCDWMDAKWPEGEDLLVTMEAKAI